MASQRTSSTKQRIAAGSATSTTNPAPARAKPTTESDDAVQSEPESNEPMNSARVEEARVGPVHVKGFAWTGGNLVTIVLAAFLVVLIVALFAMWITSGR